MKRMKPKGLRAAWRYLAGRWQVAAAGDRSKSVTARVAKEPCTGLCASLSQLRYAGVIRKVYPDKAGRTDPILAAFDGAS